MAAEQIVDRPMALLFEPQVPDDNENATHPYLKGWTTRRWGQRVRVRNHDDDAEGARVQESILRYHLLGESRATLSSDYGLAIRTVQERLSGTAWPSYAAPVLAWLDFHGLREKGCRPNRADREGRIARAALRVTRSVLGYAELGRPVPAYLLNDLRLLSGAWREGQ